MTLRQTTIVTVPTHQARNGCPILRRGTMEHRNANAGILTVVTVLCALIAPTFGAHAEDDIQLITLHSHSFFIPKRWMAGAGVGAGGTKGPWWKPQAEPIDATELHFINPDRNSALQEQWADPLPSLIAVSSYADMPRDLAFLRPETKEWLEVAASQPADAYGFVRVWAGFSKPGQPPQSEKFLYKGYLNNVGQPLIVISDNIETPFADHYPSSVFIPIERDLMLRYLFSNKKFPERTWWDLYQHTLAFVDYLQRPKWSQ